MKYINKIGVVLLGGMVLAAASCADYSDYNTAPVDELAGANKTLWENISAKGELSDFAQVLQTVGYDAVLSAPTTYTVWAPQIVLKRFHIQWTCPWINNHEASWPPLQDYEYRPSLLISPSSG